MKQVNHVFTGRWPLIEILAIAITICTATQARGQGFISPLIGLDFGGDAGCPTLTALSSCEDKKVNFSVSIGSMGNVFGIEEEFAYAPKFLGDAPGFSSSVLTLMTNIMLVPKIGPVHPYVVGGVGLIKTHVELIPASLFTTDNNSFGWDVGGGVIGFVSAHLGLRADIRYFHSFKEIPILGVTLTSPTLNYGRASAGLVLKF